LTPHCVINPPLDSPMGDPDGDSFSNLPKPFRFVKNRVWVVFT
jgi:hypothetical protein